MMNFWDRFAGESHFASARLLWARSRFLGGFLRHGVVAGLAGSLVFCGEAAGQIHQVVQILDGNTSLIPTGLNNRGQACGYADGPFSQMPNGTRYGWVVHWPEDGQPLALQRVFTSVAQMPGGFTWVHSEVRLVGIMDDGVAVGYEDYLSFDNPGPPYTQPHEYWAMGIHYDIIRAVGGSTMKTGHFFPRYISPSDRFFDSGPGVNLVNNRGQILGFHSICDREISPQCTSEAQVGGVYYGDLNGGRVLFPDSADFFNINGVNDAGTAVGYDYVDGQMVGFLWTPARHSFADHGGYDGSSPIEPTDINNRGESVGLIRDRLLDSSATDKIFLHLPYRAYGLDAGLHIIGETTGSVKPMINDNGVVLLHAGGVRRWANGASLPLGDFLPSSPAFTITGFVGINDKNWVLGWGFFSGQSSARPFLMRPALEAEILVDKDEVFIGEVVQVTIRARSYIGQPLTLSYPDGIRVSGGGAFVVDGAQDPVSQLPIPAYGTGEHTFRVRATASGKTRFWGRARGTTASNVQYSSARMYSDPVRVRLRGDLLIKRTAEPPEAFAIAGDYQGVPSGLQRRSAFATPDEPASLDIRLVNNEPEAMSYRLRVQDDNTAGWDVRYFMYGVDVTDALAGAGGMVFEDLGPGVGHTVMAQFSKSSPGDSPRRVIIILEDLDEPGDPLDTVEATGDFQAEIVVNSTGDESDSDPDDGVPDVDLNKPGLQTTLRAAIEFANRRPGKDIIRFEIPVEGNEFESGVPTILPRTPLPPIVDPVIIDGWSQAPESLHPPVQLRGIWIRRPNGYEEAVLETAGFGSVAYGLLVWTGAANGLHVVAPDCEIRGLVINHFPLCGLLVDGGNCLIQGNYLGLDPTGNIARASGLIHFNRSIGRDMMTDHMLRMKGVQLALRSPLNVVGGSGPREGNVISGREGTFTKKQGPFTPAEADPGIEQLVRRFTQPLVLVLGPSAVGNHLLGNIIGLNASGSGLPAGPPVGEDFWQKGDGQPLHGILVVDAPLVRIGGRQPGEGNLVAGNTVDIGVFADDAVIEGNLIGTDFSLSRSYVQELPVIGGPSGGGIQVSGHSARVGGPTPDAGNLILGGSLSLSGASQPWVQGNRVGITSSGSRFDGRVECIGVFGSQDAQIRSNWVQGADVGINLAGDRGTQVLGNWVFGNRLAGIQSADSTDGTLGFNTITNNGSHTDGVGIHLIAEFPSQRMLITSNSITGNFNLGISLGTAHHAGGIPIPTPNDLGDYDSGPNRLLNFPKPNRAVQDLATGELRIRTSYSTSLGSQSFRCEFFANRTASATGHGEGEQHLGLAIAQTDSIGEALFEFVVQAPNIIGHFVSATAIDPENNTSEFSPAILVQGLLDSDGDSMSDEVERLVPNRTITPTSASPFHASPAGSPTLHGDSGTGDGNADGLPDADQGHVVSFPVLTGRWLTLATASPVVLSEVLPTGPPDFTQLPRGYEYPVGFIGVTLSNLIPGGTLTLTNIFHGSHPLTTVWSHGPTPWAAEPHWHEWEAEIAEDELRLSLTDGGSGDLDGVVNGVISTLYAPAYRVPPGPRLSLTSHSRGSLEVLQEVEIDGESTFVPAQLPLISSVLTWPATATNWYLEYKDNLSPANIWIRPLERPVVQNHHHVLTNNATGQERYFRLRSF